MKITAPWGCLTIALLTASLSATPARAALFDLETRLTASDAAAFDDFGDSVAISGNTALVGAAFDDDAGTSSGSAYLFDAANGNQLFKLTAFDAAGGDRFGGSVAISGNTALVGAQLNDDEGSDSGSAYLFDVATGDQLFKLTASDAAEEDEFGVSVAISGNTALVGANGDDDGGSRSGSAYLFDVATGNQLFKLTASNATEFDNFGLSVAISGNTALVGAPFDDEEQFKAGSAFLFDVTTGEQLFRLTGSDTSMSDQFGQSVAISGTIALVGAPLEDDAGDQSGSAYLFDIITGEELFKLTSSDAIGGALFGGSVAISGNMALVGAQFRNPRFQGASASGGAAYLFDVTTGEQIARLTASETTDFFFGQSVAINGNTALVGATSNDARGFSAGSAYLFENANAVPEPSSALLLLLGLATGLGRSRNRRRA